MNKTKLETMFKPGNLIHYTHNENPTTARGGPFEYVGLMLLNHQMLFLYHTRKGSGGKIVDIRDAVLGNNSLEWYDCIKILA